MANHHQGSRGLTRAESLRRLWSRVEVGEPNECWPWIGPVAKSGYGMRTVSYVPANDGRSQVMSPHQLVARLAYGPQWGRRVVDHECHNRDLSCPGGSACPHRRCCNPNHVRYTSDAQNLRSSRRAERSTRNRLFHVT